MFTALAIDVSENEIHDFLGGDPVLRGEERLQTWPGVVVAFNDATNGQQVALRTYFLRERSAVETLDDVLADVNASLDYLNDMLGVATEPLTELPCAPGVRERIAAVAG